MSRLPLLTRSLHGLRMAALSVIMGMTLVACATQAPPLAKPASAPLSAAELDARVLAVIAQHPAEIIAALSAYQQQQASAAQAAAEAAQRRRLAALDMARVIKDAPRRGAADSELVLVEFADFQCPYCARADAGLKTFLIRHPEVSLVYKHLPLSDMHAQALPAARAAWAAQQQGRFWEFHDALYSDQKQLGDARYLAIAKALKLDSRKFERDRASAAAEQAIAADLALANELEIAGTPFFFINGVATSGALPAAGFEELLMQARHDRATPASSIAPQP